MQKITIFHYHIHPGGVTDVIVLSIRALHQSAPETYAFTLVCGDAENHTAVRSALSDLDGLRLTIEVMPEIGYLLDADIESAALQTTLAETLIQGYGGTLWWVHNYQLGKNPIFTGAVLQIIDNHPEQRILLHVHDFPECSRYENLAFSRSILGRSPYSVTPRVRYVVLNERDHSYLAAAGVPRALIRTIPNPVPELDSHGEPGSCVKKNDLRKRLDQAFASDFPGYRRDYPLLFYPVRTIRRKNILEAGLLAGLAEANLLVTLPGISVQEKPYSQIIEKAYAEGLIPGLWGFGRQLDHHGIPFSGLPRIADMVFSSSVQEGFGYLYLNSLKWRRPLVARYIDILEGTTELFPEKSAFFYRRVRVPLPPDQIENVKTIYRNNLSAIETYIGKAASDGIRAAIETIGDDNLIDFSYLPVAYQYDCLRTASADRGRRGELRSLNRPLLERIRADLTVGPAGMPAADLERLAGYFGFDAFTERFREVTASFDQPIALSHANGNESIQTRLQDIFAQLQYLRPLFSFK